MIFLAFVLSFLLIFTIICKPFEAHAAFVIDDAIAFTIATIALSLGLSVATNHPAWGDACLQIYNDYISPVGQAAIDNAIKGLAVFGAGYLSLVDWEVDAWEDITTGIINYLNSHQHTNTYAEITVGSSGKIGFTEDSLFSFELDHEVEENESFTVPLTSKATLSLSFSSPSDIQQSYPELNGRPDCNKYGRVYELSIANGLKYVHVTHSPLDTRSFLPSTFQSKKFSFNNSDLKYFYLTISPNIYLFNSTTTGDSRGGFYADGYYYNFGTKDGKYGLINQYNGQAFDNQLFNTTNEFVMWLCNECEFAISIGSGNTAVSNEDDVEDYAAPVADSPITGDSTAAQQKANDVADNARATDSSISTAIPTTDAMLDVVAANPAVILDPSAAAAADIPIKPADLPDIDTGKPQLWTTKFPFCLPFDIARLITDFSAEPVVPKFSLLLMPANSFGLQNEEITVEIDFELYDKIVKILRFFLAAAFVFFLIKITRKLIS